ncbi:MAG TPA: cation transporter [Bacteroidetes bacterium]|jgi:cobalt-zinc-cadmium efflux system protein|uniref:cation diffusion facilitator family transporter n=1 Tax=Rubrivirga sp. SAORIC476 TaxID=1961794 RepID=UPI000BA929D1|nr:cation diffusion facilitator family transporter [Rubrivirga sp. SAORIC476]MAQ94537.1 cation transporter [Rhodothermaceae bacterium]HIG74997.1 cation transporter [Bacteroidota bacterium]HIL58971.1 cation transporter [Rhodothermales bacterium]MBC14525.1 cation transporter [Rhodothermaceae bacterium]PAP78930.1 zinc ABC transporter [Rubrivirga sp. SAORIC476]
MKPTRASSGGHGLPPATAGNARALKISGLLTGVYFVVELAIGLWTGSVSVTSDAFHTFSAVGGVLVALVAGRYAERPATDRASYGLVRAEIVGALFNGLFLLGMAALVLWMGAMRLRDPMEVETGPMLWAAAGGLVTEVIALRLLYARQKGNLNMKGAFWHVMQTFVGSILIIVAALVIRFTGFLAIDPILGMGFGVVLVWASWGIIRGALRILLQAVPDDLDLGAVKDAVEALPGVREAHHLHAWALTTGKDVVSLHVLVDEGTDAQALQRHVFALLRDDFDVYFSTVQVETTCLEREEARAIDATWAGPGASAAMPPGTVERGASSVVIGPTKPTSNGLHGPPR